MIKCGTQDTDRCGYGEEGRKVILSYGTYDTHLNYKCTLLYLWFDYKELQL